MSKVIEDAAQDFAEINDDKAANSAHSYSKYDIADAYQQGADFGYCLAENRIKKEYEEKLRWIPVEERLPENQELVLVKTNRNCVSTAYLHGKISGFITYGEEAFVDFGSITHWRSIFL